MYKNYFFLNRLVIELNLVLKGYNLVECFSQEKDQLVLHFIRANGEKFLIITANQNEPHCIIRDEFHKARKNYIDFFSDSLPDILSNIEIACGDRVIRFCLDNAFIYFFIRGKETNILFSPKENSFQTFKKADSIKTKLLLDEFESKLYTDKIFLPDLSASPVEDDLINNIHKNFPFVSKEIVNEAKLRNAHSIKDSITDAIKDIFNESISVLPGENTGKYIMCPSSYKKDTPGSISFNTVYEATQYLFSNKYKNESINQVRLLITKSLKQQLERTSDKLNEIKYKLEQPSQEEYYRKVANILLSNIQIIRKGSEEIELEDLYASGTILKIKLDKKLSPKENIDSYFEKAKNEKENRIHLNSLFVELEDKLKRLLSISDRFNSTNEIDEYRNIMKELKINPENKNSNNEQQPRFKHYVIEDKYHLFVGKDSRNNDELTTKFAKQNDYWFHARAVSGSHAVLRVDNSKEVIPKNILKKAASIAAYHSKAKTSKLAPVSYTLKKFVVKRKGMEPGKVSLLKEEVLLVEPSIPNNCVYITEE